ncbi:MAG TPA: hypothetical protein VIT92_06695 [Burkholderiaceae bacterium]
MKTTPVLTPSRLTLFAFGLLLTLASVQSDAAGIDPVAHAALAEKLVANVGAADNSYNAGSASTVVTLAGVNGATEYRNLSACAPFVTQLIKLGSQLSETTFRSYFNSGSPTSSAYNAYIVAGKHFTRVTQAAGIRRGDVLAVSYLPCAGQSATGHTMIATKDAVLRAAPTAPLVAGTVQYEVEIADSTSSPHGTTDAQGKTYADTRTAGNGAGIGTVRIYADAVTGEIAGYSWSMSSGSIVYLVSGCRTLAVGRLF